MPFDCDEAWHNFCSNNDFEQELSFVERETKSNNDENIPKCSDLYISTTTKISYFDKDIDLFDVFWKIPIISYSTKDVGCVKKQMKYTFVDESDVESIKKKLEDYELYDLQQISFVKNDTKNIYKDVRKINIGMCEKDIVSTRSKKKSAFYNCFVLIVRLYDDNSETFKENHVKIFNTGKLEMPGIKCDKFHNMILTYVKELFRLHCGLNVNIKENHETVLINSNFTCNFCINREKLTSILKQKYKIETSYDPCSYPGIMSKKLIENSKKKISFMIFRTGSVLIVGKCSLEQIEKLYLELKEIFKNEYNEIAVDINFNNMLKKNKSQRKKYVELIVDS